MENETTDQIAQRHWQKFLDTPRTVISGTPVFMFPEWVLELIGGAVKDGVDQAAAIAVTFVPEDFKTPAPRVPSLIAERIRGLMLSKTEGTQCAGSDVEDPQS